MSKGKIRNKIKIKTNKAASKRFKLKKRNPIGIFYPFEDKISSCGENTEGGDKDETLSDSDYVYPFFFKRGKYSLTRTVAGLRHSNRKKSRRSLSRRRVCVASVTDLKRKYSLRVC